MSNKIINILGFLLIAVFLSPLVTSAAIGVTWTATSTTPGYISPNTINGYAPGIGVTGNSNLNMGLNSTTGFGSSTPYANLSIHANNGDTNTTLFAIGSSTATATSTLFSVTNTGTAYINGSVGIGTTTPWAQFSINPNGITGPVFAIGSSTATNFVVTNAGTVGIGTTSPLAKLNINSGYVNSYPIWSGMYTGLATTLGTTTTAYGNAVQNITAVGATNAFGSHIDTITATGLNFFLAAAGTAITRISSPGFAVGVLIDTVSTTRTMSVRPAVGVAVTNVSTNSAGDAYGVQLLNISNASTTNTTNSVAALEIENSITNTANTANVYSIRSLSTAKSYFAGSVGVASTSPFARLSVHAPNGVNTPTLFAIGSSTQTATTTLMSVDNMGNVTSGNSITASTTRTFVGKWQMDTYNTAGTEICAFFVGTTLSASTGACNQ